MINPRWGDEEKTIIHTDDNMSIPTDPNNADFADILASGVKIEGYVAPEKTWAELRGERDALLNASDWMGISDRTMSDAQATYRQRLRDIPQDHADPAAVVWPTPPDG
jgi:hypothetical protein